MLVGFHTAPAVAQRNLATNQEVKLAPAIPIFLLCLLTITLLSLLLRATGSWLAGPHVERLATSML